MDSTTKLIKLINNSFQSKINNRLKDGNLTNSQAEVLLYTLKQNKKDLEVNQIDIQNNFNLTNPTVTGILNRLEEKRFIKRTVSKKNARFKSIIITEFGIKELEYGKKEIDKLETEFLSNLTEEEKIVLNKLLKKLIDIKESK